jgi:hypothetical protein
MKWKGCGNKQSWPNLRDSGKSRKPSVRIARPRIEPETSRIRSRVLTTRPRRSTISGKEYKLWSSSLCSFIQSPLTSSMLGPNIYKHSDILRQRGVFVKAPCRHYMTLQCKQTRDNRRSCICSVKPFYIVWHIKMKVGHDPLLLLILSQQVTDW